MSMFKARKPRGFNHRYIYYDERKEKLDKMEEDAKRELGMIPPKEFNPEDIRGKFVENTSHLKRRMARGKSPIGYGKIIIALILLIFLLNYLITGDWRLF